ncbi:hypothetical protein [Pseudoalteromonas luteoviolacea]|uniref:Uncharacterized protein n=1 Tax=Pseudoalteromonas luteoviolacea H33 TaxID=1365251 RepID=A0A167EJQ2_9GAMM|nr:hypothetical protein [Pseudoalteromonas luteoviolacea]KZN50860.1 hypothetical protein N476_14560 [Pseudoalteromonas luteoviolacea H33]KZN75550.1 hypothetical protein N477_18570 [Pseudoalteromonas luteoviolacea H33-S]
MIDKDPLTTPWSQHVIFAFKLSPNTAYLRGQCWRDLVAYKRGAIPSAQYFDQLLKKKWINKQSDKPSSTANRIQSGKYGVSLRTRKTVCKESSFYLCEEFYQSPLWRLLDPLEFSRENIKKLLTGLPIHIPYKLLLPYSSTDMPYFKPIKKRLLQPGRDLFLIHRLIYLLILFRFHKISSKIKVHMALIEKIKLQLAVLAFEPYVFPHIEKILYAISQLKNGVLFFNSDGEDYFRGIELYHFITKLKFLYQLYYKAFSLGRDRSFFKFIELYIEADEGQIISELEKVHANIEYSIPTTGRGLYWLTKNLNQIRNKSYREPLPLSHRFKTDLAEYLQLFPNRQLYLKLSLPHN